MNASPWFLWRLISLFALSAFLTYSLAVTASAQDAGPSATAQGSLDAQGHYQVVAGDTLYGISRRFQVGVSELQVLNGLVAGSGLRAGQRLILRNGVTAGPVSGAEAEATHQVSAGETLYGIAGSYGVTLDALAQLNQLSPPYVLTLGQVLRIPGTGQQASAPPATASTTPPPLILLDTTQADRELPLPRQRPTTLAQGNTPSNAGQDSDAPLVTYASIDAQQASVGSEHVVLDTPPPRSSSRFMWPVRGRILSSYGAQSDGMRNDGINIAVTLGAEIRAAEAGLVSYVGRGVRGFGLLILISHQDGWYTVYGNTTESYVQTGQEVTAGQRIAAISESFGAEHTPQLHFEIRLDGRAVDPIPYLSN